MYGQKSILTLSTGLTCAEQCNQLWDAIQVVHDQVVKLQFNAVALTESVVDFQIVDSCLVRNLCEFPHAHDWAADICTSLNGGMVSSFATCLHPVIYLFATGLLQYHRFKVLQSLDFGAFFGHPVKTWTLNPSEVKKLAFLQNLKNLVCILSSRTDLKAARSPIVQLHVTVYLGLAKFLCSFHCSHGKLWLTERLSHAVCHLVPQTSCPLQWVLPWPVVTQPVSDILFVCTCCLKLTYGIS